MATTDSTLNESSGPRLRLRHLLGLVALLAPLSYLAGRLSTEYFTNAYVSFFASGVAAGALGFMLALPIGLFFGTLRGPVGSSARAATTSGAASPSPSTREMERTILEQLTAELTENKTLLEARKGSTTMYARIEYVTSFWTSIKASGRLFVMQDAQLLAVIGTAYYWLDQASHLETLAYEAKYASAAADAPAQAERLISEVRLLDGQLENSLDAAINAIGAHLAS